MPVREQVLRISPVDIPSGPKPKAERLKFILIFLMVPFHSLGMICKSGNVP
jgi:hypothetical protein